MNLVSDMTEDVLISTQDRVGRIRLNRPKAIHALNRQMCEAMSAAGIGRRMSSQFVPNMTLLYDRRMVAEQAVEPVHLTVREFALVHSLVRQSRHIELARWPLQR